MNRGIYKIINTANQKFYVGSSVNLSRRKARHFRELAINKHPNKHLQAAWDKYGAAAFEFVIVELVGPDEDILAAENRWLKEHVGKDYCYNLGRDATAPSLGMKGELSPTWGRVRPQHERDAISRAGKLRVMSEESKRKISRALKGNVIPAEVREKISESLKGEKNPWFGKKRPEFAEKVRKAVFCPTNGVTYPSVRHAREALGISPPTINRALKSGQPISRGPFYQWEFRYVEKDHAPQNRKIEESDR